MVTEQLKVTALKDRDHVCGKSLIVTDVLGKDPLVLVVREELEPSTSPLWLLKSRALK
jgi:hypothetical protein